MISRIFFLIKNMLTLQDIKSKLKEIMPFLREKYNVDKIGIFGSFARGEQNEGSDVDILVEFIGSMTLFRFVDLKRFLEERLNIDVDLVTKNGLKPIIKDDILSETIYI